MLLTISGMTNGRRFTRQLPLVADTTQPEREMQLVNVYPQLTGQTIHGFGGAFTDAAGYVYSLLSPAQRKKVVQTYFGPGGMNYRWGRTSIDSSDFGLEMYAADDDPADTALEHMDFTRAEQYVLPLLRDAEAAAGEKLSMMLTPWTPPAWMKTNGSRVKGGHLREECEPIWAEYVCKYVAHCLAVGMDVRLLSTQNEPHAVQTWDSCWMEGEQERRFISEHLGPALRRHGLDSQVGLLIWDHNKERLLLRASQVMGDPAAAQYIAGSCFHWYTGDHFEALTATARSYPGKRLVFSEGCVEHSVYGSNAELPGAIHYAHEYIGDLNHGADTLIEWNLLLDEQGGPNHVGNYCDAPMMYDRGTRRLQEKLSLRYIGHFSRYIQPGAVQVATSSYHRDIEATAAKNLDGSLAVVVLNQSSEGKTIYLAISGEYFPVKLPAGGIATAVYTAEVIK